MVDFFIIISFHAGFINHHVFIELTEIERIRI